MAGDSEVLKAIEAMLATCGLTLKGIILGAFGSFISLRFWTGQESAKERWAIFFGGCGLAAWGGEPLRDWLELPPKMDAVFIILTGVFGMAVVAEVMKAIRAVDWGAALKSALERFSFRKKKENE